MNFQYGRFTTKAALLWAMIPQDAQLRILANVFCVKCREAVQINNFNGEEIKGNLSLKGFCAKCGQAAVRVVETSEIDRSGN